MMPARANAKMPMKSASEAKVESIGRGRGIGLKRRPCKKEALHEDCNKQKVCFSYFGKGMDSDGKCVYREVR